MDQKELIDRLRRDPKAVQSLMTSADGQRLMQLLSGGDGGRISAGVSPAGGAPPAVLTITVCTCC